jgi:cardiolipin-specific phospholipase
VSEERLLRYVENADSDIRLHSMKPHRRIPSYSTTPPTPTTSGGDDGVISYREKVMLPNSKNHLNMFAMKPTTTRDSAPPPVVVLHGYGAGLGFFFLNFPTLAKWAGSSGTPVYALDWLGMGRSSRPAFQVKAKRTDIQGRVEEAESFFLNSLEQWREHMGLEKMTLVGHSLGTCW